LNPAGALALKLVLTPVLVGAASLAGRRWGSAIAVALLVQGASLVAGRRLGMA
jgi:hypothetical protein